ncbi:MAG: ribonuclease H family protein [Intestinibacter sp.]
MAKKKVYAIKEGFDFSKNQRVQNKLVDSWSECQKYIKGVKGAIYKGFEDVEEAKSFLQKGSELLRKGKDSYDENCLHIYVDGSYNSSSRKFSYGVVAVYNNIVEYVCGGFGKSDKDNNIRQIAGELKAALEGVEYALKNNHKKVVLFYDYEGICHHATGFWQRKDKSSKDYYEKMNRLMDRGIEVQFVQVKSHEEDLFNEMADTICKRELGIDNDKVLEKYLSKNQILVKNKEIKGKIEDLVTTGYENIVVYSDNKNSEKKSKK